MSVAIVCDDGEGNSKSDCDVEIRGNRTAQDARRAARAAGWKRDRNGLDICPVCQYGQWQDTPVAPPVAKL